MTRPVAAAIAGSQATSPSFDHAATDTDYHTDLGNARRLVNRHGANIRFIPEWRKWIVWERERWELDTDGAVMRLAKETVEAMYTEALTLTKEQDRTALLRHALKSQAEARLKAIVAVTETEVAVIVPASKLDADPWVLGVENGVIDLRTGTFRQARREDLITKRANVSYYLCVLSELAQFHRHGDRGRRRSAGLRATGGGLHADGLSPRGSLVRVVRHGEQRQVHIP